MPPVIVSIPQERRAVPCLGGRGTLGDGIVGDGGVGEMRLNMPIQGPLIRMPVLAKGMEAKVKLRLNRIRAFPFRESAAPP